jgi:3,4-dihydroxy 2-butanone 4-phosphate synthase/GTP cyclohydrolase II
VVNLEVDVIAKYVEKLLVSQLSRENAMTQFATIEEAVKEIAAGRAVVVVDDENRENEGDLIFAAEKATTELLTFMVRHTSGFICAPITEADADRLELPPMYYTNQDRRGTAYTVTVDAREGVTTGISAAERAHTIRLLADPATEPGHLARPGHVVPLRAKDGGVLRRPGHTEAAVDLARLAGLRPAGVLCELVNDDGTMKRLPDLRRFADEHGLALVTIADLIQYRRAHDGRSRSSRTRGCPRSTERSARSGYRALTDGSDHVALVYGDIGDGTDVLVRVHSECLTGDVFGSLRCDCGPQLRAAILRVAEEGRGVVLYVRGHEGRASG